jgi:hypothetical protein
LREWDAHNKVINQLALSRQRLYSCSDDCEIRCWRLDGGKVWSAATKHPATCIVQAEQGIIVGCENGELKSYTADDGKLMWCVSLGAEVRTVCAFKSGLVVAGDECGLLWCSKQFGTERPQQVHSHSNAVHVMAASLKAGIVVTGCQTERRIIVWCESSVSRR